MGNNQSKTSRQYGWFGGAQRSTETTGGFIQMGQRTYLAPIGRFLQTDPVDGGSANAYDYANQDPINQDDLNGEYPGQKWACVGKICWAIGTLVGGAGGDTPQPHRNPPPPGGGIVVDPKKRPGKRKQEAEATHNAHQGVS